MRGRLLVAAVLALALVLRLGLALIHDPPPPAGDAADYVRHAVALADHGSYPESAIAPEGGPTAFRPPGYPVLLGGVFAVFGNGSIDAARAVGALVGTAAVALLGLLALQLFGRRAALAAMAIAAVFPPLVVVSVATLTESLFIALVLAALTAGVAARKDPGRLRWVVAAGVLAGLAALTRTNGLVLLLPLLLAVPRPKAKAVLVLAAVLVLLPWSIRSSAALDAVVPTTTQTGFTLAGVYNDEARTDARFPAAWRPAVMPPYDEILSRPRDASEAELEGEFRREALGYAADHPLYVLEVVGRATLRMANAGEADVERLSARELSVGEGYVTLDRVALAILALAAIAGAFTRAARAAPRWLWLVPVLLWLSTAITASAALRYRMPIDPFLVLLAALAVTARWPART